MEKKILQFIKKNDLAGKRLVLAVSGGVDSVVLLNLFARLLPAADLVVAHLNHAIRKESDREVVFVEGLAKKYGIGFTTKKLKIGEKSEETARIQRYEFLRSVKEDRGASYIVTAHHLDDQAETVILNLVRGSGPIEIWGMKEVEGDLLRPFLGTPKAKIQAFAQENKLKWVNDPSNNDLSISRNRVRKRVIPELQKINPNFLLAIDRTVRLGQESTEVLEEGVKRAKKRAQIDSAVDLSSLKKEKAFIQKEIIRRALLEMTGKKEGIYSKNVEKVTELADKNGSKKTIIGKFTIEKIYDKIIFGSGGREAKQKSKVDLAKSTQFNNFLLKAETKIASPQKNNILLPVELAYNLSVRGWQEGDKIKTASGTKKLQDIFTDAKIPRGERSDWPIVVCGNEIVWIPLLAASEKALKNKSKAFVIEVKNESKKS